MAVRYLGGQSLVKISASSNLIYRSCCPKSPETGPNKFPNTENRGIFWVKLRTTNIQKLKVIHLINMDGWYYYRLCENFCWTFGAAPGANIGPIFLANTQKLKVMDPKSMGRWSYYKLCENFCWHFGCGFRRQFRSNFSNWAKTHQQFSRTSKLLW